MGFTEQAALAKDPAFRDRVSVAIAKVAIQVQGEPQAGMTEAEWAKRASLAGQVLQQPAAWLDQFSMAVVTNSTITGTSPDNDIEFTVTSVWSDVAGVSGRDIQ